MATISLYASKINNMPSLINDVKKAVTDYKSELTNLKNKALKVNTSVCDLSDVVSEISSSTKTQDEKIASLEALQKNSEQFVSDTVKIDNEVADLINKRKDEFYNAYTYLRPECEKNGWEKFCDGVKSVGEWCKEHWVMLATIVAVIVIAVVAVVTFGVAVAAIAAIAGIVSLTLCVADSICIAATGGKSISDLCRENGIGWLGEIFDGISFGCDIVSIVFPAGAAIKTMSKVGVRAFFKGTAQALSYTCTSIKNSFRSSIKNGIKDLGKAGFKMFIFDVDDFSYINTNGKRTLDIFEQTSEVYIKKDIKISSGGLDSDGNLKLKSDGTIYWPENDGFDGKISEINLRPEDRVDRYGSLEGKFVSPEGTPYKNRALKPGSNNNGYNLFKIMKPTKVKSGEIASWFNELGGGIQYKFYEKIENLLESGNLRIVDYTQLVLESLVRLGIRDTVENTAE